MVGKIIVRYLSSIFLIFIIFGCKNKSEEENFVTEKIEASNFVLEITSPSVIKNGQMLKVEGKLTYVGDVPIELSHGEPIIRFSFTGSDEHVYTDGGFITKIQTGQTIKVEEEFKVTKAGKQSLKARTTLILVDGKPIKGIGNEEYIKNETNEELIELGNSKITSAPLIINVK